MGAAPLRTRHGTVRLFPLALLVLGLTLGALTLGRDDRAAVAAAPEGYVVVRHVFSLSADGMAIVEEETRTGVSAAFVVNPNLWDSRDLPVAVSYNAAGAPPGLDLPGIIQEAISSWNGADAAFSFAWAGSSAAGSGACGAQINTDGINTILFKDQPGTVLGITCSVHPAGNTTHIVEFDMEIDNDAGFWAANLPVPFDRYDLPTTVLHELGHAAGLGHSCSTSGGVACTSALTKSVMYRQISAGESRRALTADDIAGIRKAYPPPGSATPGASPTATPSPTGALPFRIRAPLLSRD